jgi:hypothetical protein
MSPQAKGERDKNGNPPIPLTLEPIIFFLKPTHGTRVANSNAPSDYFYFRRLQSFN